MMGMNSAQYLAGIQYLLADAAITAVNYIS